VPDSCDRADALFGLVESTVTGGSGMWASRADLGVRPTKRVRARPYTHSYRRAS